MGGESPMHWNDVEIKISKKAIYFIICDDTKVIYENEEISLLGDIFSFILGGWSPILSVFIFVFIEVNSLVNDVTHNKWGGSMSLKGFLGKFMSSSRNFAQYCETRWFLGVYNDGITVGF